MIFRQKVIFQQLAAGLVVFLGCDFQENMKSLSSLGIGLSLVFGCLLLALVAELYYLFWWKKRISNRDTEEDYSSSPRELFYLLCWKKPASLSSLALNPHTADAHGHESDDPMHSHSNSDMDFVFKPFGEDSVESELMRLHNLSGPPRFLFTIKEETKEDLESDDGRSIKSKIGSRGRSLSDVVLSVDTPFLTPLSSPPFLTPPLTPMDCYKQNGFNPLFESSIEAMMSSPPPKFKFLKDAEEKLHRKRLIEGALKDDRNGGLAEDGVLKANPTSSKASDEADGSFITILIGKNKEKEYHASSSQVLPLPSSPSEIRSANRRSMFHER